MPVVAAEVVRRDIPIYLDGLGSAIAYKTITVRTQVDGQLLQVNFHEGQRVRRGDLLALVDPSPFKAQLEQARGALARDTALLENSRLNLRRFSNLRGQHLVAQENVDDQKALVGQYLGAIRIDKGQIAAAQVNIRWARITSPIDGVTGIRLVDPGNVVHAADPSGIVVVTQLEPIAVLFTLPQDDLPYVAREQRRGPLRVELFNRDGAVHLGTATVSVIDNQINQTTATMRLKAIAPNPEHLLWPNQFVKARLLLTTRLGALVIPWTAVQHGPQGTFVFVIGADETVSVRTIEVELTQGDSAIVKSGLRPGERVVVEGQSQLSPGGRVSLRPAGAAPDHAGPADGGAAPDHGGPADGGAK